MATELDVRRLALGLVAASSLLAAPSLASPTESAGFLDEDRCTLTGPLHVVVEEQEQSVLVAKGTALTVTRSGRRFSEVRAGDAQGMVENQSLESVCKIPRQRCQVVRTLTLTAARDPRLDRRRQPGQKGELQQSLRLQPGGGLVVMRRNAERAQVRVGELFATVSLPDLLAACPQLEAAFAKEDAAKAATKPAATEGPASMPAQP